MSKKLMLINADHPEECRAVLLENGKVEDLIVEHASHEQIKGNVYLATINRVEPSIEAAFLDIGGRKFGFLPFKDVRKDSYLHTGEKKARTRIQDVLVRGQKLLVQVVKEGRDAKGPSLTNWISIPGRFLVLMAGQESSAISRKIEDEGERKKLREIITEFNLPENMGVIIRTAGLGRTKAELQKDLQMLMKIWENINDTVKKVSSRAPALVYREPDLVVRTVRDHFTTDTSEIIVDDMTAYKAINEFVHMVMPRMHRRVKLYQETKPLFSQYHVEEQIDSIYDRKVLLPSGGSIVFDSGEAMVSIDVNSGKTTGASQLEETAVNTNLEAADEIARQLRLRDLGGLVVIDFIDMFQKKNKSLVEKRLKQGCKNDKARINISRISKFGLLEMSRQRMSPPVKEGVFEQCSLCRGSGLVKSSGAAALGVLRKIQENLALGKIKKLAVEGSPEVGDYLLNHKMKFLMELQERHHFQVEFISRPGLSFENFTYTVLERKREEEPVPESRPKEFRGRKRDETRKTGESAREGKEERKEDTAEMEKPPGRKPKTVGKKRYTRRKTVARKSSRNRTYRKRVRRPESAEASSDSNKPLTGEDSSKTGSPPGETHSMEEKAPAGVAANPMNPAEPAARPKGLDVKEETSPPPISEEPPA
ncbi:MAG: Rne/Rng family ribonuclease [Nitrospinaceae bacterium]